MMDSKRTGNKFTYKMECTGNEPSTMDGEVGSARAPTKARCG